MGQKTPAEMIERLSDLLHRKLGTRGTTLEEQVRRAGRRLPGHVRRRAQVLVEAERLAGHPRLATRIDPTALARALSEVEAHLSGNTAAHRRTGLVLAVLGRVVAAGLLLFALWVAIMLWQDRL